MINKISSVIVLLIFSNQLFSQQINNPSETGTTIFFEMGGKWFYSANILILISD